MTSFIIKSHENRRLPLTWTRDPECAFCRILKGEIPAGVVYEDDNVIAILGELRAYYTQHERDVC